MVAFDEEVAEAACWDCDHPSRLDCASRLLGRSTVCVSLGRMLRFTAGAVDVSVGLALGSNPATFTTPESCDLGENIYLNLDF